MEFGGGGIRTHVPSSSPDNPISSRARYVHFGTPPQFLDARKINEALQKVLALFSVGLPQAGVYVLQIPDGTPGGNDAVKAALSSATNKPPDSLDFSVGMMMMGGSASIKPLMTLLAAGK